jgi:hypothetical protein
VVELSGHRVTIFNTEGRLEATASRVRRPPEPETFDCSQPGLAFEAFAEDSPAKLRADERRLRVWVEAQEIWLEWPD